LLEWGGVGNKTPVSADEKGEQACVRTVLHMTFWWWENGNTAISRDFENRNMGEQSFLEKMQTGKW